MNILIYKLYNSFFNIFLKLLRFYYYLQIYNFILKYTNKYKYKIYLTSIYLHLHGLRFFSVARKEQRQKINQ